MTESQKLRLLVRDLVKEIKQGEAKQYKKYLQEKKELRKHVRGLLMELDQVAPHSTTAINTLRDLLKTIIPIAEEGYKNLTSSDGQRESFKSHIENAVRNLLAPVDSYFAADEKSKTATGSDNKVSKPALPVEPNAGADAKVAGKGKKDVELQELNGAINVPTTGTALPPSKVGGADAGIDPKLKSDYFEDLPNEDKTGRNFALRTFKKIEKQILDAYSLLELPTDREIFYEYLFTNLDLYFKKFEDELKQRPEVQAQVTQPADTTQATSTPQQQTAPTASPTPTA
jgi:hypothetical protein